MAEAGPAPAVGNLVDAAADLLSRGDYAGAMELAENTLSGGHDHGDAVLVLAAVAFRSHQLATAIRLLDSLLDENAAQSDIPELLAVLHCLAGNAPTALYFAKLTTIIAPIGRARPLFGPDLPSVTDVFAAPPVKPILARGKAHLADNEVDAAIGQFEQHLELFPNDVEGLDAYSDALALAGRPQDAVGVLRSVLALGGPSATLYCRLGCCLTDLGEHEQARACHAEALARAPKAQALLTTILLDLDRHNDAAQALRGAVIAALTTAIATTAPKTVRKPPPAVAKPKICIGYLCRAVNGEFRDMVARVAQAHDRTSVSTVGFGDGELTLAGNAAFRGAFDRWVNVAPLDELTLSVIARGEGVDVLVDADGLLTATCPHLFARNSAPVQLTWFAMPDGFTPTGSHGSLAESAVAMGSLLLPRAAGQGGERQPGPVVFAADLGIGQLNADVARVWSAILHAVPESTLALSERELDIEQHGNRLMDLFGNFGVAHRIDLVAAGPAEQMFANCDVALAPFPAARIAAYGKALSLGVPVIALEAGPGRLLANSIRHSGFAGDRMIAATTADYVARACDWAADAEGRRLARRNAEAIVAASPAFDAALFAAGLERHVREQLAKRAAA